MFLYSVELSMARSRLVGRLFSHHGSGRGVGCGVPFSLSAFLHRFSSRIYASLNHSLDETLEAKVSKCQSFHAYRTWFPTIWKLSCLIFSLCYLLYIFYGMKLEKKKPCLVVGVELVVPLPMSIDKDWNELRFRGFMVSQHGTSGATIIGILVSRNPLWSWVIANRVSIYSNLEHHGSDCSVFLPWRQTWLGWPLQGSADKPPLGRRLFFLLFFSLSLSLILSYPWSSPLKLSVPSSWESWLVRFLLHTFGFGRGKSTEIRSFVVV